MDWTFTPFLSHDKNPLRMVHPKVSFDGISAMINHMVCPSYMAYQLSFEAIEVQIESCVEAHRGIFSWNVWWDYTDKLLRSARLVRNSASAPFPPLHNSLLLGCAQRVTIGICLKANAQIVQILGFAVFGWAVEKQIRAKKGYLSRTFSADIYGRWIMALETTACGTKYRSSICLFWGKLWTANLLFYLCR